MISVEGYVLAGGLSSRMGRKKANIMLGGKTLAERAVVALSAITGNVAVVGNVEVTGPLVRVVPDEPAKADLRGAIVGLYSALRNAKTEWAAVLACDLPFVTSELMIRLAKMAESLTDAACVVPVQPDGRTQPLCGIYRTDVCRPEVERLLSGDDWRLQNLLERIATHRVAFAEIVDLPGSANFFFNVNSPDDFEIASQIVAGSELSFD